MAGGRRPERSEGAKAARRARSRRLASKPRPGAGSLERWRATSRRKEAEKNAKLRPKLEQFPAQSYAATLPGITKPFDLPYYDPTELSKKATIAEVRRWREAELTHGRVAMLAALGWIVGEQADSSRAFFNADGHIQGTALEQAVAAGPNTWAPILLLVAALEARRVGVAFAPAEKGSGKKFFLSWGSLGVRTELADGYSMGDAGFDPLGLYPTDPARQRSAKDKELNNGRLAMVAVAGFCLQELAEPGVKILDHRWN